MLIGLHSFGGLPGGPGAPFETLATRLLELDEVDAFSVFSNWGCALSTSRLNSALRYRTFVLLLE